VFKSSETKNAKIGKARGRGSRRKKEDIEKRRMISRFGNAGAVRGQKKRAR